VNDGASKRGGQGGQGLINKKGPGGGRRTNVRKTTISLDAKPKGGKEISQIYSKIRGEEKW